MKKLKNLVIIFIGISILLLSSFAVFQSNQENKNIVGVWLSSDDSNWKLEFKNDNTCQWSYTGELPRTYEYSISKTSPQCGENVPVGELFSYLKLKNISANENEDVICYEIVSLNNTSLQLRFIHKGGFIGFEKQ